MSPRLEERVAHLEGQISEQSEAYRELRELILHVDQKVDRFREELQQTINGRFNSVDRRFENLETRMQGLEQKVDRQFRWLVGLYATTMVAVFGAIIGPF